MQRRAPPRHTGSFRPVGTTVTAAVLLALYGLPLSAGADPSAASSAAPSEALPSDALEEVIVTAGRRSQTLEDVPYNLTVVSADDLARTGVRDLASLTYQVPGLSVYDFGARFAGATSPIIRGINADGAPLGNRMAEQSPVGTYIGNSPVNGSYFQLDDIERIEVLRGPQGTLYGAGSLGGALRIIPNAPQLDTWAGSIEASGGTLAHSGHDSYGATGMLNIPIGETLALRVAGKYQYDPGFINVFGILERPGSPLSGIPLLADPSQPVTSPGIYTEKADWNEQKAFTGRASLLWKPFDGLTAQLAEVYAKVTGDGGPQANSTFPGGAYPIDPRIAFPAGGDYQTFSAIDQPFSRDTTLTSLDVSYDVGFATLSSTSSYYTTLGATVTDDTYGQALYTFSFPYYSGVPTNPRFVSPFEFDDSEHTFSQEIRLVSTTDAERRFDYVAGLFYENQNRGGVWDISAPGSPEYSAAEGCTAAYTSGASFPNCLVIAGPHDITFAGIDQQHFEDKSLFGELTWHFLPHGALTVGGRHFDQQFTDAESYSVYTFGTLLPAIPQRSPASRNIWKVNPSYEYAPGQHVYALWSQGFRRGGASAVPLAGPFQESPALATYKPDSTDNYEAGLKGRFENGTSYTVDVFDIQWVNPQIAGITDAGNYAVWNANRAESKGVEFDLRGPLIVPGLTYVIGGAYSDAKLTENYALPGGNGAGQVIPGLISGTAGSQLPGSPKESAAATVTYARKLTVDYDLSVSLNGTYKSAIPFEILIPGTTPSESSSIELANLSAVLTHAGWKLTAYSTNLFDKRALLIPASGPTGNLYNESTINRPRELGLRVGYSF
jgi:outer membrane receptor protein involved in Fe transport